MQAPSSCRQHRPDLLARPPCLATMYDRSWAALLVDPAEQLVTLADLLARGLLSPAEYEQHKARVLEP